VTFAAEFRHLGFHTTAIRRVVDAFGQALGFQSINQLGDIGADTGKFLSQLAQAQGLVL
jgi:hypothetical protein